MFVLKPENNQGRFVSNLRTTICVLKNSCKLVPKTAFKRPVTSVTIKKVPIQSSYEIEFEPETDDDFVVLDEPTALFDT